MVRIQLEPIQGGEDPANGSVTTTGKQPDPGNSTEKIEGGLWTSLTQVEDLSWIQPPLELLHQLGTLVAPGLGVEEDDNWAASGTWDGLQQETRLVTRHLSFHLGLIQLINRCQDQQIESHLFFCHSADQGDPFSALLGGIL